MNASRINLKFNYLYRDAGNYKNFGSAVFGNPNSLHVDQVEIEIRKRLISNQYFDHEKFKLSPLFFESKNDDDLDWHEFESIVPTEETASDLRPIEEFLKFISNLDQR